MVESWVEEKPIDFTEEDMARKRTPKGTTPTETETPVQTTPELQTTEPATTAQEAPPVSETTEPQPSFVERVQQRRGRAVAPDPFGIAGDVVAGVRLFESRRYRQMAIKFEEKPPQEVLDLVKSAGYRWNSRDLMWVHPIHPDSAMATRIEAERLFQEVRGMVRQAKGIDSGQEVPF